MNYEAPAMNGTAFRRRLLGLSTRRIFCYGLIIFFILFFLLYPGEKDTMLNVASPAGDLKIRVIPRIIHQTFMGRQIPTTYWKSISAWRKHHPEYVYFLWTDNDIQRFMKKEYPDFIELFNSYQHKLQRIDAVRYFILYHYGGVYADMDVSALRTLDPLLQRYSCIISRERYEQSMFLWGRPQILMNAVMASSARHPFMKFIMFNLHAMRMSNLEVRLSSIIHKSRFILSTTGPLALTDIFSRYPPCQVSAPQGGVACDVYLARPYELLPRIKPETLSSMKTFCQAWYTIPLRLVMYWKPRACSFLDANNYKNDLPGAAYTDHEFSNLGYQEHGDKKGNEFKDISELVGEKWKQYTREQ